MKTKNGFALVFTLIIASIIIIVIMSFTAVASGYLSMAGRAANTIRAYHLAEAGLARKFVEIREDTASHADDINNAVINFSTGNPGSFSVDVTQTSAGIGPNTFTLRSTGTYKDVSKTIIMTAQQTTIARYIYMTNVETRDGSPIWFIGGDIIRGPLHTNGQMNIYSDPIFEGPVSSVSPSINYYHGPPPLDNPDFQGTLTLGAPNIQLPASGDMVTGISSAASGTTYDGDPEHTYNFTGNTTITLLSNGTMDVTNYNRGLTNYNIPLPANGAVFVNNGTANISGILSGQLTIAAGGAAGNINIISNILYNSDPRTDPNSTDILGLVSQNNVTVDYSAPNNLEIDAYIITLNTSFSMSGYTSLLKGMLTLYGGIAQVERGPIGTFNAVTGQRLSGYIKDYNYDARLKNIAPAYFPPAKDASGRIVYIKTFWQEL